MKNEEKNPQRIENAVAQTLVSLGFHEAMNNSVVKADYQQIFGLDESKGVKLLNPLSSDLALMRQSMMPGLLENIAYNLNRKNSNIKLFEFGKIYNKEKKGFDEKYRLAIVLSGNKTSDNWANPAIKTNFYTLKGIVMEIMKRIGITDLTEKPVVNSTYSDALSLEINGQEIGVLGIVSKPVLKKMDVSQEVFFAELNWDLMVKTASEFQLKYKEISKFPAVKRDLALLLDKSIVYHDLFASTQEMKLDLVKSVQLFDVYEGDKLPEGKKSYAMSFTLLNEEKTLSDVEIDEVMNKLIRNFQKKFNAELRN